MTTKFIGLLITLTLISCSTPSQTKTSSKAPVTSKFTIPINKTIKGSCETVSTLKTGESPQERDSRVWSVNSMTNTEADLIANALYPQIVTTGTQPAKPITSIQKNIEEQCQMFASEVVEYQSWVGATAACLYPKCVKAATAKLNAKMK